MKRLSFSFLTIFILSFIIVQSCSSEEDDTIAPNVVQTPEPEPSAPTQYSLTVTAGEGGTVSTEGGTYDEGTDVTITATPSEGYRFTGWEGNDSTSESLTITLNSNQTFQALFELIPPVLYFPVNIIGNGTYQRSGSPYPPLNFNIELISGNINDDGNYSKGSILRLLVEENPGWMLDYSHIGDGIWGQDIQIEDSLEIKLDVSSTRATFPFNELNYDGTFLNVGNNIGSYAEWNEPNKELNYYVTENFMYPEYIEAYKDRIFEIRQLLGEWGPLDILIYDWEENSENNREMFKKTREGRAAAAYQNQLISDIQNWVEIEMENYDETVRNNGWPFGSADSYMGYGKQIGSIYKNKFIEYIDIWSNNSGLSKSNLINSDDFHWEWETGSYHEYIHIWQASQNKHGFVNAMAGCHNCNDWTERDPNLNRIWIAPRWFQEGQCAVIQSILSEKMELRADQSHCCTIPPPIFKVRNYIEKYLLNNNLDRLRRDETGEFGYYTIGEVASFYKFAKMNYSIETFMAFETHKGTYGYASALQEYIGLSEDDFYITFNNWYFDSNLTTKQKLDYLYPEEINPIQMDIENRR